MHMYIHRIAACTDHLHNPFPAWGWPWIFQSLWELCLRHLRHVPENVSVKSCKLFFFFFVRTTALWNCISHCSHLQSRTKVVSDLFGKVISFLFFFYVICLRFTSLHIITYVAVEFCDEQSLEQTAVTTLNMHERCTSCSGCIGVNDFLLSHYHKLWFIGIVAWRQRDMITQSSGT